MHKIGLVHHYRQMIDIEAHRQIEFAVQYIPVEAAGADVNVINLPAPSV
jgi:hypothetical protein